MPTHLRNLPRWPGAALIPYLFATAIMAQTAPVDSATLRQIMERLDRLEQQNRDLAEEVHALRKELALSHNTPEPAKTAGKDSANADLAERMDVDEHRLEEQAQTKVESSQHFPIRITGMALFNAYTNSSTEGGPGEPTFVPLQGDVLSGGASLRQTVLGLDFRAPRFSTAVASTASSTWISSAREEIRSAALSAFARRESSSIGPILQSCSVRISH